MDPGAGPLVAKSMNGAFVSSVYWVTAEVRKSTTHSHVKKVYYCTLHFVLSTLHLLIFFKYHITCNMIKQEVQVLHICHVHLFQNQIHYYRIHGGCLAMEQEKNSLSLSELKSMVNQYAVIIISNTLFSKH